LDNQNELWQAINGTDIQYFKNPNLKNVSQETLGKKTKYEYDLTPTATGEMYFYVAPINYDHSNVYVNGQRIKLGTDVTSATVLDLGYFKKGESVNVNIVTRKELGINPGYFKTLDQSEFDKSKVQVQRNSLKVSSNLNNDTVKGTINVKEDNPMLLTIPYDDGWKAFDNGKKISTHKVVGNLTAIDLKKGHHDIVMKYEVPGLKAGWIITVIAIILFGLYYIYRKFIGVIDDYD
jgi:Predicted membrane protein